MDYKKIMQKIIAELKMYKSEIDKLAISYQEERKRFDEEMEAAEGKFTESYIAETRANWKPRLDYAGLISMARETHARNVAKCITQLEQQLNDYFSAPADANFCSTLVAVKALGLSLSDREFSLLQESANGYVGRRLLNGLAVTRTKTEQAAKRKDGEMTSVQKEKPIPYTGVDLPDIEQVFDGLQNVKNAVSTAFGGYCGENFELQSVLFPPDKAVEDTSRKLAESYGTKPQKQTLGAMEVSKMATSVKCFDENHHAFTEFAKMMDGINATIPKPPKKTELTEDDKKLIDLMIEPQYPSLAAGKAAEIAKSDSRLAEILLLDERYGQRVREALGKETESNE